MTWATVIAQYEATGPRKLDGYSPAQFEGMSADEQAKARVMLIDRALAEGDIFDLNGLRFVGDAGTVARLAGAADAADRNGRRFDIIRLEVLFVLTGDHAYLHAVTRWLDDRDPAAQERAADALASHPLTPEFNDIVVDRITDGRHEDALPGFSPPGWRCATSRVSMKPASSISNTASIIDGLRLSVLCWRFLIWR